MYVKFFKRLIDIVLSGCALIVLSPLYLILIVAIKLDSHGPVLFKQKRVGIHKTYLHEVKFTIVKMTIQHIELEEIKNTPCCGYG
jgi:O-antigen biosynthesis protein WbqP